MTPKRLQPHPRVHQNRDSLAIRRGPFIYALESVDQDGRLTDLRLAKVSDSAPLETFDMDIKGKPLVGIKTKGTVVSLPENPSAAREYIGGSYPEETAVNLTFIPYFAWGNRGPSDMRVWIPKTSHR